MRNIPLSPIHEAPPLRGPGEMVAFGVGPDQSIHLVDALGEPDRKVEQPGWAVFFKPRRDRAQVYRVTTWEPSGQHRELLVPDQDLNFTHVQPLGDELLLACARGEGAAVAFDRAGIPRSTRALGDGIQDVQVAADGTLWVSYFDEGIYRSDDPVGGAGLVRWSLEGKKLYEYAPPPDVDTIDDCYAMNVDGDDVWVCYYAEFPIVRLRAGAVVDWWTSPVTGSGCVAVYPPFVLFAGSYDDRHVLSLVELLDDRTGKVLARFRLIAPDGTWIQFGRARARGFRAYFLAGRRVFTLDVLTCLRQMMAP